MKTAPIVIAYATCLLVSFGISHAADQEITNTSKAEFQKAQKLLADYTADKDKGMDARESLLANGFDTSSLGFETDRANRNALVKKAMADGGLSTKTLTLYEDYALLMRSKEKRIAQRVTDGQLPKLCSTLARFERLRAEVELARISGRLPIR